MGNCTKARVAKGLKVHVSSIAYLYLALCFYVPKTRFCSFLIMLGGPKSSGLKPSEIPLPN